MSNLSSSRLLPPKPALTASPRLLRGLEKIGMGLFVAGCVATRLLVVGYRLAGWGGLVGALALVAYLFRGPSAQPADPGGA